MTLVLQNWLIASSWKEQTVVLCALRGPDAGGSPEMKAIVRWIRRVSLKNAAPKKTFMQNEPYFSIRQLADIKPLVFDMLPVHFLSHLMHALQVIGYRHSDFEIRKRALKNYADLCRYLHVSQETELEMTARLKDEVVIKDDDDGNKASAF